MNKTIKELPEHSRPRKKLQERGPAALRYSIQPAKNALNDPWDRPLVEHVFTDDD